MKVFCLIVFVFFAFSLHAQHAVRGRITDANGNPVKDASVFLRNTSFQTTTDETGMYSLNNIPKGEYVLAAFLEGKKTSELKITVKDDLIINVLLKEFATQLDEVTITGQKSTTGIDRMEAIENFGINEAKKNEVVVLGDGAAPFSKSTLMSFCVSHTVSPPHAPQCLRRPPAA